MTQVAYSTHWLNDCALLKLLLKSPQNLCVYTWVWSWVWFAAVYGELLSVIDCSAYGALVGCGCGRGYSGKFLEGVDAGKVEDVTTGE